MKYGLNRNEQLQVAKDLAAGASVAEVAKKFDVHPSIVSEFTEKKLLKAGVITSALMPEIDEDGDEEI
jgi:transposase